MQTFTDEQGRAWKLKATVNAIKRIREQANVDLTRLLDDKSIVTQALSDPCTFIAMLFAWCQPQCESMQVSDEDFAEAMYGDTFDLALEAFKAELPMFFPHPRRTVVETLIRRHNEAEKSSNDRAMKLLNSDQVTETMLRAVDQAETKAIQEMTRIAGGN